MPRPSPTDAAEIDAAEVSADTVAVLFFDFLRQLSTLALAGAGGTATLLQTVFAQSDARGWLVGGAAAFSLSALFALQTQQVFVERLAATTRTMRPENKVLGRIKMRRTAANEQRMMYAAFALFGVAVTLVGAGLFLDRGV